MMIWQWALLAKRQGLIQNQGLSLYLKALGRPKTSEATISRKIDYEFSYITKQNSHSILLMLLKMNMIRKGQIEGAEKGNIQAQNQFIAGLFGLFA